jgi:hypothetical protein
MAGGDRVFLAAGLAQDIVLDLFTIGLDVAIRKLFPALMQNCGRALRASFWFGRMRIG